MKTTKRAALMNVIADAIISKPAQITDALNDSGFKINPNASQKELAKTTAYALNKNKKFAGKLSNLINPAANGPEMINAMGIAFGGLKSAAKPLNADGMFADRLHDGGGITGNESNDPAKMTEEQKLQAWGPEVYAKYLADKAKNELDNQIEADKAAKELQDALDWANKGTATSGINNGAKIGIIAAMVLLTVGVIAYAAK